MVGAYMTDPLWIAEYTLYLEQNFCVGHPDRCKEVVKVREGFHHAGPLSLIESFMVLLRQLSYAIKNQLIASKAP